MKRKELLLCILCLVSAVLAAVLVHDLVAGNLIHRPKLQYSFNQTSLAPVPYPDARFAVISDIHYYAPSLGKEGPAFEACLQSDRKLLRDSTDLLALAIADIIGANVEFVLIPGDLSKDGELICHQAVADTLSEFRKHGIKVYVVPGNHDISNQDACQYQGDQAIPVANINPAQFADIYRDYGYGSAIYRDPDSLSYVVEPVANLWVIALDVCSYRDSQSGEEATRGGKISQSQEKWLEAMLEEANQNGKAVIFMDHHGVVEHWTGQSKLHPDYLVQDYLNVARLLASYHVRLAFTGHYHAQDITLARFEEGDQIYDVETGALITAPCPVRYCTIADNTLNIRSTELVGKLHPGTDFEANAYRLLEEAIEREADNSLRKYHVPVDDAQTIAHLIAAGFVAHYRGDEDIAQQPVLDEGKLSLWSRMVYSTQGYVIEGLWNDLPPDDNYVKLELGAT